MRKVFRMVGISYIQTVTPSTHLVAGFGCPDETNKRPGKFLVKSPRLILQFIFKLAMENKQVPAA